MDDGLVLGVVHDGDDFLDEGEDGGGGGWGFLEHLFEALLENRHSDVELVLEEVGLGF